MLFKSGLVTQGSGSLGGMTISHNKGGYYIRSRTIPVNPGSPQQSTVRQALAYLSNYWVNTLSEANRALWETYAKNVTVVNPLGDAIELSGINHFVRSNTPRLQAGMTIVEAGPLVFNLGEFTAPVVTASEASQEASVAFTDTDPWAIAVGGAMFTFASRPQNPTINYFKGPYRYMSAILGAVSPPTSPDAQALPFQAEEGNRVFVMVRVTQPDGRLSLPFRDTVIMAA